METGLSDDEIIARVLGGDIEAFGFLFDRYQRYVAKVISKYVPADDVEVIAIEVFTRAYKSLENFQGTGAFRHWLATIATRCAFTYLKSKKRKQSTPVSSFSDNHVEWLEYMLSGESADRFDRQQEQKMALEVLDCALSSLSPEDRMIVTLVHLEEKTTKEAAAILGWSEVNVRVRALRARKALKNILLQFER